MQRCVLSMSSGLHSLACVPRCCAALIVPSQTSIRAPLLTICHVLLSSPAGGCIRCASHAFSQQSMSTVPGTSRPSCILSMGLMSTVACCIEIGRFSAALVSITYHLTRMSMHVTPSPYVNGLGPRARRNHLVHRTMPPFDYASSFPLPFASPTRLARCLSSVPTRPRSTTMLFILLMTAAAS